MLSHFILDGYRLIHLSLSHSLNPVVTLVHVMCCDSYHSNVPFQASLGKDQNGLNEVMSLQEAEDLKLKEKRRREREVHFPSNLNLMVMLIVHVSTLIGGCVAYDACFGF